MRKCTANILKGSWFSAIFRKPLVLRWRAKVKLANFLHFNSDSKQTQSGKGRKLLSKRISGLGLPFKWHFCTSCTLKGEGGGGGQCAISLFFIAKKMPVKVGLKSLTLKAVYLVHGVQVWVTSIFVNLLGADPPKNDAKLPLVLSPENGKFYTHAAFCRNRNSRSVVQVIRLVKKPFLNLFQRIVQSFRLVL